MTDAQSEKRTVLPADARGMTRMGWLNSAHSFSFGHWYDPQRMGFSDLRVINDDRVAAGGGFPPHPHANMEILSYVLSGALKHRDSLGNTHTIEPGEIQIMSAGSGITHSEMNASGDEPVHFLQIWIEQNEPNAEPRYAQAPLDTNALNRGFVPIAGTGTAVPIRQDARVLAAWPQAGTQVSTALAAERRHYLHVASGTVDVDGTRLAAGDALTIEQVKTAEPGQPGTVLDVTGVEDAQILLFDLRGGDAR